MKKRVNKQLVLTVLSLGGVVATGVSSYICAKQVDAHIRRHLTDWRKKDKKTKAKETAKYYILPVVTAGATCYAIIKNHKINGSEIAILSASGAYLATNAKKFESKAREQLGDDVVDSIKKQIVLDNEKMNSVTIEDTGLGNVLCIEGYFGRIFWSCPEAVEEAQRKFNELRRQTINGEEHIVPIAYNEYFYLNNLIMTHQGEEFGYAADTGGPDGDIEFVNTYIKYENVREEFPNVTSTLLEVIDEYKCDVFISEPKNDDSCPWYGWMYY